MTNGTDRRTILVAAAGHQIEGNNVNADFRLLPLPRPAPMPFVKPTDMAAIARRNAV